jgi:hypothetical protein
MRAAPHPVPRRGNRRWILWLAPLAAALFVASVPAACSTTIVPPATLSDPVPIFLLDYGMTSALAVPHGEELLAYAYGDWQYYALSNDHGLRGAAALLWPTQGTLGRGRITDVASETEVLEQLRGRGAQDVFLIHVEREAVARLVTRLEALYDANRPTEVHNVAYGMRFVHHPRRYSWFWNSNHQTAQWLEELGCEVRGPAFVARWRIDTGGR